MYKPVGGGPPAQASGGPLPEIGGWRPLECPFSSIFPRFYKVSRISPPQTLDFGGAILPPEFALSFDVYKGFQVSPPPDIGIRMIRHDAQNTV